MSTFVFSDLPRSLLNQRIRREVDATVTDYVRLGDWDEQLAASAVERMLHHQDAHGVMCSHWAEIIVDSQPRTSSGGSPMPARGLASQAAEVARRMLLRLLPSRPELFTSSVCTLLLGVLHFLLRNDNDFSGSQQQYEDTVECALRVLEGPTKQQQQQLQQPKLLAPARAMGLLAELCISEHAPLLRVLRSARCTALAARCLFNPHDIRASSCAAVVLDDLLDYEELQEETSWACDPILFTSTIENALGHAESCMLWRAAYGTSAFVQAARVPWNECASNLATSFGDEVWCCTVVLSAMRKLPFNTAACLLMRRPGLLRTLCDGAARHVAACGASSRTVDGLCFDRIARHVVNNLVGCTYLIGASPLLGPAHVRAMELGLSCLLRMCERAPRLKATTMSAMLLSFKAWHCIHMVCGQLGCHRVWVRAGGYEQSFAEELDMHRARAALAVFGRTHALRRLLEAAVSTERWLEGWPRGIADVSRTQPCRIVDALLEAALLSARCVSLVSAAPDGDGIGSTAGQQQQRQQHLADVQRIYSALLAAREHFGGAGGSALALRVPAQVQELVRDLQRAIAALAPHGIPDV